MTAKIIQTGTLEELVEAIRAAIGTESFYTAGKALEQIRDERLYRTRYDRFENFTVETFDLKKSAAYSTIAAARFVDTLDEHAPALPKPEVESQARPMSRIKEGAEQAQVWKLVVETAPEGKITAAHVKAVVDAYLAGEDPETIAQASSRPKPAPPDPFLTPIGNAAAALQELASYFHAHLLRTSVMGLCDPEETIAFFRHELGRLQSSPPSSWRSDREQKSQIDLKRGIALFQRWEPLGSKTDPKAPVLVFALTAVLQQPETSTQQPAAGGPSAFDVTRKPAQLPKPASRKRQASTPRPAAQVKQTKPKQQPAGRPSGNHQGRKPNEKLRAQVLAALKADPSKSNNAIAADLGCSKEFVRKLRGVIVK